jgi:hypothetical protein
MTIKDKLTSLTNEQRTLLMDAFDANITQLIVLDDGTFIGVYVVPNDTMIIEIEANHWTIGRIKDV